MWSRKYKPMLKHEKITGFVVCYVGPNPNPDNVTSCDYYAIINLSRKMIVTLVPIFYPTANRNFIAKNKMLF